MIVTRYINEPWKPWVAWDDEATEGGDPMGRGQTEAEALADLQQRLDEPDKTDKILSATEGSK